MQEEKKTSKKDPTKCITFHYTENDNTTPKEATQEDTKTSNSATEELPTITTSIKQELDRDENDTETIECHNSSNNDNTNDNVRENDDDCQPKTKRPKIEFVDAESNTLQTGKHRIIGNCAEEGRAPGFLFVTVI